jgi:hypothetical protein
VHGGGAVINQAAAASVDGQLKPGIVESLLDIFGRCAGHLVLAGRQYLGQMHGSNGQARAVDHTLKLH